MITRELIEKIKKNEIDCNAQASFFGIVIRGLILALSEKIRLNGKPILHTIMHTGDDTVFVTDKGQDFSQEPYSVTNEDWPYAPVPCCYLTIGSIDTMPSQLTSPYSRGSFQIEADSQLFTLSAEFRRVPIQITIEAQYYVDSFNDALILLQAIIANLIYVHIFRVSYMGQIINCSYQTPESFSEEHLAELAGDTTENKKRTISFSLIINTNIPVFNNRTVAGGSMITTAGSSININSHEINKRYTTSGTSS